MMGDKSSRSERGAQLFVPVRNQGISKIDMMGCQSRFIAGTKVTPAVAVFRSLVLPFEMVIVSVRHEEIVRVVFSRSLFGAQALFPLLRFFAFLTEGSKCSESHNPTIQPTPSRIQTDRLEPSTFLFNSDSQVSGLPDDNNAGGFLVSDPDVEASGRLRET